jgi:hypothetical protein
MAKGSLSNSISLSFENNSRGTGLLSRYAQAREGTKPSFALPAKQAMTMKGHSTSVIKDEL